MKRLLTLAAMFLCCVATSLAQFSGSGSGTEEDPYLIFNQDQLSQVSNFLDQEGVVFKLMKDLDLANWIAENNPNQGWLPIGVESSPFRGIFYGNNHKVTGLMIKRNSTSHVGFFGYVSGATINNFTIEGSSVVGNDYVGVLVGSVIGSTITNCHIKMTGNYGVKGNSSVGGFAGYSNNTTYNTFSASVSVFSSEKAGGLIGCVESGTFTDGTVSGTILGTGEYTGGLIGWAKATTLTNIIIKRTISGQDYTGGITGYCENGIMNNCTYEGDITGEQYVGGVSGILEITTTSFTNCSSKGKITGISNYVGGIIGASKGGCIETMEGCWHFGNIEGKDFVGGIVGCIMDISPSTPTLNIYNVYKTYGGPYDKRWYSCDRTFSDRIVSGSKSFSIISNCTAIGEISGNDFIGGIIGCDNPTIAYTPNGTTYTNNGYGYYYTINGEGEYWSYNGRFTYYDYIRSSKSSSLENDYYSGNISGREYVGGIVGSKKDGIIISCYSNSSIYGKTIVGGIAGGIQGIAPVSSSDSQLAEIKSCVANNTVVSASSSNIGRIYGKELNPYISIGILGTSQGNRALTQTRVVLCGVLQEVDDDLQNGTSIGPAALKLKANYVSWGWNFDENWDIQETECYPYKKYQAAPPVIESNLISQATTISGKSLNGGTVYLYYKDRDAVSTVCNGHQWTFNTEALQSGALVQIYADVEGMTPSYFTTTNVGYPGSGTEDDPWRIYTAEDLQGACNRGYYKLMNDIDLTSWINENSPTKGWIAVGRNSGEATYIDGDGHKVSGLWIEAPDENFTGLFSNFSAGQIKNLNVEVATGKKVRGADYTGILIGRNANGRLVNCTVKGQVEGTVHVGGVVGYAEATTISSITFNGGVKSTAVDAFIGGVAGQMLDCTVTSCNAAATIEANSSSVGGLAGQSKGGTISKSTVNNTLSASGVDSYVGGLIGYSETPVTQCIASGNVTATGDNSYTGGLVGYALAAIDNSYSTAKTTGTWFTGGLVGYTFSSIDKCYAKGDIYGSVYGGGVVGELDGPNATLTNSVACNNILSLSAQSSWGSRVIGGYKNGAPDPDESNYALKTMQVSLNDVPQKVYDDIVNGTAKTAAELMSKATYQELDWDFTNVWKISEGAGYPYLTETAQVIPDDPNPGGGEGGEEETPDTDISNMNNVIYLNKVEANAGSQLNLSFRMKNTAAIRGFQFDLYLPEGVTAVKSAKGKIVGSLSEDRRAEDDEHTLTLNEQSDGAIRFLCGSLYEETFTGNDGEVATLSVKISETMEDGNYAIILKNIKLTESDINNSYQTEQVKTTLTIKSYILGDINNDGKVDVSDYIGVANRILNIPQEGFNEKAADVNEDGVIDVSDYIGVANIILTGSIYGTNKVMTKVSAKMSINNQ